MPKASVARPLSGVAAVVGVGGLLGLLVAGGVTVLSGARPLAALGLPDPGTLTSVGLPVVRAAAQTAMVVTVGALLTAAFLVPPQRSGYLEVSGYRSVRIAGWSAATWAAAAALLVPLNTAEALGRPLGDVLDARLLLDVAPRLATATAWFLTFLVAVVVVVACRTVLTWGWTVVTFGLATAGLLPVALTGHASGGGAHDLATDSLVLHVLAASLWVGGLVGVLIVAAARGPDRAVALGTAVPRFSRLALWCWCALAVTGVLNSAVRVSPVELVTTGYGLLLLGKATALVALGAAGALHRRYTVHAAARSEPGALLRLGGLEVVLMLATVGLAVALARTAPPADGAVPSRTEVLLGYDLAGPPTLAALAFDWRFDLVFGSAAVLAAVLYLTGVRRLRRRGDTWPVGRTGAWTVGCVALLVATSSGLGRYGPAMFSVHMAGHMILSMLVPILLVLGAPVTLALRALPPAGRTAPPGPREWLLAAVHSPAARLLSHPLVTLPLFVGSYYALYLSDLFAAALPLHWAHVLMNLHFLVVGTLFFWPLIGVDPAPRRLAPAARLGLLFLSVPFHAFFGVVLMSSGEVIGGDYYRALALPWVDDPLRDQQLGGGLAWASGEIPLLLVVVVLLVQWARDDERSARRDDRRADGDGEADLAAYNAMLHRLATGEPPSAAQGDGSASSAAQTGAAATGAPGSSPGAESAGRGRVQGAVPPVLAARPQRPFVARRGVEEGSAAPDEHRSRRSEP